MLKFKIEGKPYEVPDYISIENYVKIFKVRNIFQDQYLSAKIISIITDAPYQDLLEIDFETIDYIGKTIMSLFPPKDDIEFKDRFELNGVNYGFLPNWKDLTFAEFIDIDTICNKKDDELLDNLHILAAIFYRPITNEISEHNFEIEDYNIETLKTRSELFKKQLSIEVLLGAQFFFIKFAEKYSNYSPTYLKVKMSWWDNLKMIWTMWRMIYKLRSKKPSVGSSLSTELVKMILLNTNISTTKRY